MGQHYDTAISSSNMIVGEEPFSHSTFAKNYTKSRGKKVVKLLHLVFVYPNEFSLFSVIF